MIERSILKSISDGRVARDLNQVNQGKELLSHYQRLTAEGYRDVSHLEMLTVNQSEILILAAKGMSGTKIALQRRRKLNSISNEMRKIYRMLDVTSIDRAIIKALTDDLIPEEKVVDEELVSRMGDLSPRHHEIMSVMLDMRAVKPLREIAEKLDISTNTLKTHMQTIFKKVFMGRDVGNMIPLIVNYYIWNQRQVEQGVS